MKVNVFLTAIILLCTGMAHAQDADSVTQDELKRYAEMMDSIDEMRVSLLAEISDMVKNNEKITVARYNDLFKIIDDEEKLKEANATPEEIEAVKAVQNRKETGTVEINDAFKSIAKEYVGASTYNKVKKAIAADPQTKTKYESMLDELKQDNVVEEDTGG